MLRKALLGLLLCNVLLACNPDGQEARRLIRHAEQMVDPQPDSTLLLIDSVMRLDARLSERERMALALLQGKALFEGSLCQDHIHPASYIAVPLPDLSQKRFRAI